MLVISKWDRHCRILAPCKMLVNVELLGNSGQVKLFKGDTYFSFIVSLWSGKSQVRRSGLKFWHFISLIFGQFLVPFELVFPTLYHGGEHTYCPGLWQGLHSIMHVKRLHTFLKHNVAKTGR